MNFQEAEKRYAAIRDQLNKRQITEQQFAEQVFALRLQDSNGAWWQVNGADGSWLVWNGTAWQPATPPSASAAPQAKASSGSAQQPAQSSSKPKSGGGGLLGWISQIGKGSQKATQQGTTPAAKTPGSQMEALYHQVRALIQQKRAEGYIPTHPSVGANLWGSTVSSVMQTGIQGITCSHCNNFAGWGIHWLWPIAIQVFGDQVTVTEITCYRNEWISHRATRLILPDGQRYVVDFWEGMLAGEPRIYSENDWITHYRARVGGNAQILTMEGRS
jgi:hypothetical protein